MVRASISEGRPYDIILMDHQMPRMSGPEAADIGLIVGVSRLVLEEDEEVFLSHGANRVVSKLLDMSKVLSFYNVFYRCTNALYLQR